VPSPASPRLRLLRHLRIAGLVALLPLLLGSGAAQGALITGSYQINWDQDVDKTEVETKDVRKFKQTLELKYKGLLAPLVQNEATFKFEQEINSNAPDVTRFLPTLDLAFKGRYWEAKSGGKRTHENSDEPGKNPKITDSYYVEFFYLAPKNVPDLKAKYTLDKDFEEGVTDTAKQGLTLSSVYRPTGWLDLKGDYSRNTGKDHLKPDADTEDEKASGTAAFRHVISDKIKVDAQYSVEESRSATLLTGGGATNEKRDQTHTVKSAVAVRPFRDTNLDGSFDVDLKQDMITGKHTLTKTSKAAAAQKVGTPLDLRGDFNRVVTEERHGDDDNRKTEDTWTAEVRSKFSKFLDLSLKYQKKDTDEVHFRDPSKNTTSGTVSRNASWTGEIAPFWKAQASADLTDTFANEVKTTVDTKYSLKSTLDFKAINLSIEPGYDITFKDDLQKSPPEKTVVRDFKVKIADRILSTRTLEAKVEHTYGRKTDSAANNVQRTDSSTGNVSWKEPFPGWTFSFDVTRSATDTSEDDLPPDITSSFGFKADYKRDRFSFGTSYKYDKKSLTDNSETFDAKAGWTAPKWDVSLTYTFDKTFSAALNEGYSISLAFKYNL